MACFLGAVLLGVFLVRLDGGGFARGGFGVFLRVLRLELFRGERLLARAFVGVPVGLAGDRVLERLGVVSRRGGKVATAILSSCTVGRLRASFWRHMRTISLNERENDSPVLGG